MNRRFLTFLFCLALLYPLPFTLYPIALAQGIPNTIGGLELSASTNSPSPGQTITLTAQSYSADINSSKITWVVNGKTIKSADGATTLDVQAPTLGKKLTVNVTAVTTTGTVLTNSIVIGSGSVDMIVEPNGYVPPFFKGKLPISYQNDFKIIALPHIANASGIEYDPKTLVYSWEKNGQAIQDQSGYGKMAITLTGDLVPRAYSIDVKVSTRDNSAQASGLVTVDFQSPAVGFYIDDPLYGPLYNSAINNNVYIGSQKETGVLAVPFGFSSSKPSDLNMTWLINGVAHPELSSNQSIVLRAPDGVAGTSNIELDISNDANILQSAKGAFNAVFSSGAANPTTSFLNDSFIKVAHAQTDKPYQLLAPLPCIQTYQTVSTAGNIDCPNGKTENVPSVNFQTYVQYAINLIIALSAVAAVFMIVVGGIQYMTTDAVSGKSEGISKAKNAVYGLLLILCSYIILRTIDPRLVAIPTTLVPKLELNNLQATSTAFNDLQNQANQYDETARIQGASMQALQAHQIATQKLLDDTNKKLSDLRASGVATQVQQTEIQQLTADAVNYQNQITNDEASLKIQIAQNGMNGLVGSGVNAVASNVSRPDRVIPQINDEIAKIATIKDTAVADVKNLGQYDTSPLSSTANYTDARLQLMKVEIVVQNASNVWAFGDPVWTNIYKIDGTGAEQVKITEARAELQPLLADASNSLNNIKDPQLKADLQAKIQHALDLMDKKWPPPQ